MQATLSANGVFATENASKYMQQLCKHFAHKVEVRYDDTSAEAALPPGPCRMQADDSALQIEVTAEDADGLKRAQLIIDDHLARFAFREEFKTMNWS